MSGNLLSGVYVTAVGNIDIYYTTTSANGQDGFSLQTDSTSSLWCGSSDNNGTYGLQTINNNALYLYGMEFNGNALGSFDVDGGKVFYGDCNGLLHEKSYVSGNKGINVVSVGSAREPVQLNCQIYAGTKLTLPNGDFVFIPCPLGEAASLQTLGEANLPGVLPGGNDYESGFNFEVMNGEQNAEKIGGMMTVSFVIPDGVSVDGLTILFWNGREWVQVDASKAGTRFEAQVDYTGTFVLVSQ